MNYVGGKYKLLGQIIPLIPPDINTFVDLFGGGFNVGVNVSAKKYVYNDINNKVVDLLKHFYTAETEEIHNKVCNLIKKYGLSRSDINGYEYYNCNSNDGLGPPHYNKQGYLRLRRDYNASPDWTKFYTLITCSFSNQIRFNSKGEFNMPYGKRDYNKSLQEKLKRFCDEIHKKQIQFWNRDFRECNFFADDFIYLDPPYFNSTATYNENGGWTQKDENDLLNMLDIIDKHGKFALSNNLKYDNPILNKWKNRYHIHYLSGDYSNCNYQKKDKSKDVEILITNY